MQRDSGFTLIEIAITIAIFAVLAAIAVPNMIRWKSNAQFRASVNTLAGDLALAKQAAIRGNANAVVTFSDTGYSIFLDDGSGGGTINDGDQDGSESTLRDRTFPSGVSIDSRSLTFPGSSTYFDGKGLCTATGSLTIYNSSDQRSISVNRIGRIDVN